MTAARPYATARCACCARWPRGPTPRRHPLLQVRGGRKLEVVVLTSDKGLCGGFNANIIRTADSSFLPSASRRSEA